MGSDKIFAFIWVVLVVLISHDVVAQIQPDETKMKILLAERGISEDTLRARLIQKGFDPDNVAAEDVDRFQNEVLATLEEIEQEASSKGRKESVPVDTATSKLLQVPQEPPVITKDSDSPAPVDKSLGIYGQEIFRNNSIAVYQKTEDVTPPDSYVLDAGDRIGVLGFGRSQFEEVMEIGPTGFVRPKDRLPIILLKGIRWADAKEILFQRYSQYHVIDRSEFIATLVKPRNMTVHVYGEAHTTGAFTLPGVNTAINVISAAGGPTNIGSVRRIRVIRGNKTIPLDIYAFMNDPSVADNYYLQNNDFIHIPVAEKVVSIKGAVTRQMTYELLEDENLAQLIRYAGGALPRAYLSDVQVTRFLNERKVVTNVNLKELMAHGGDYILMKGDVVEIKSIEEPPQNFVHIEGAVVFPGQYENKTGMRISDLIQQTILKPEARLDFALLLRYQPDATYRYERIDLRPILDNAASPANSVLQNQDRMQIMTLKSYADPGYFTVLGAVKKPSKFDIHPEGQVRIEDALLLAGGVTVDAADHGYIIRKNPKEPRQVEYIPLDIKMAIEVPSSEANIPIQTGDIIQIFSKTNRRDHYEISVFGAVRFPGKYEYASNMSLADVINLAGGFTYEADNNRIDIARVEIDDRNTQRITLNTTSLPDVEFQTDDNRVVMEPFDHVYVRSIPEFEFQQTVRIRGEVKYPGEYPLMKDKERIYDIISRAGGLTGQAFAEGAKLHRQKDSIGLVVINLDEILDNKNTPSNIVLIAGDVIMVPKSKDLVTIEGYVNLDDAYTQHFLSNERSISVAYRGDKKAKYYVDKFAAGVSPDGDADQIKVQYADGRVQKTRKFLFFNNYPRIEKGSHILVGAKAPKPEAVKAEKKTDWGTVLRDTMAQATAVLTLLILVDQLSK